MVVKVASADVPHRSDVGAVQLGIKDEAGLRAALALIEKNVRAKVPGAAIDGYEMQEELIDCVQAMVGYQAAPPYGALTIVGSGGVLVELEADKALSLSPVTAAEAGAHAGRRPGSARRSTAIAISCRAPTPHRWPGWCRICRSSPPISATSCRSATSTLS